MAYLFEDTGIAARRLKVLADVFAPSTSEFVQEVMSEAGKRPQSVVDLGCGPGYTTHLLADLTRCERAIGLDNSQNFIKLAQQSATERISFALHDVTRVPFPVESSDLISCRYLLTHLQDPQGAVELWATQLRPGGLLLLEEVEWIQTNNPRFRTYLNIVAAMLAHQANTLYIGPFLNKLKREDSLRRRMSRVYNLPVTTAGAATMFYMNIQVWKQQPFIQERYAAAMIDQLEEDLRVLAETSTAEGEIEWGLRQIAFERL